MVGSDRLHGGREPGGALAQASPRPSWNTAGEKADSSLFPLVVYFWVKDARSEMTALFTVGIESAK